VAVRARGGYGLLLGVEVDPDHREAVLAHEVAHYVRGDLFWEPFTDGPGRLLAAAASGVPPIWVIAVPFLLLGAPLARATELEADRLAAGCIPSYGRVLSAVASRMGPSRTLMYPGLSARARHVARDSMEGRT
jgi:Zn-dependent protease with chaperone function